MISLSLLSLVGRTRSWGRFLFITRQRGRVCCCSSVITCMISIYKGCVLDQWDCYNILFCFIASKTFLFYWKLIGIYVSLRTVKLLFQKCMNFLNYIMFGYIHLYVWQISNFFKSSSTVYVDCSPAFNGTICIIATVTWPGQKAITFIFKNKQMCKILFLLFWNASWLSFTSHSMKLQLVDISGWVNNPNYNLGFIKTQNRTSNYHFTKILHRNTL